MVIATYGRRAGLWTLCVGIAAFCSGLLCLAYYLADDDRQGSRSGHYAFAALAAGATGLFKAIKAFDSSRRGDPLIVLEDRTLKYLGMGTQRTFRFPLGWAFTQPSIDLSDDNTLRLAHDIIGLWPGIRIDNGARSVFFYTSSAAEDRIEIARRILSLATVKLAA